jgi:hypothetical protein
VRPPPPQCGSTADSQWDEIRSATPRTRRSPRLRIFSLSRTFGVYALNICDSGRRVCSFQLNLSSRSKACACGGNCTLPCQRDSGSPPVHTMSLRPDDRDRKGRSRSKSPGGRDRSRSRSHARAPSPGPGYFGAYSAEQGGAGAHPSAAGYGYEVRQPGQFYE